LTNTQLLREVIQESGLKYKFIAAKLNLSPYGLTKKVKGVNQFKSDEISMICDILHLNPDQKEAIFFGNEVE
jgi:predicted transcriptional regulator